jgi:TP901 family phage tail tape measure protein
MATRDLTLAMKLLLDSQQFVRGLVGSSKAVSGFTRTARNELGKLGDAYRSVEGRLAAVGVGVGVAASVIQSAKMDKSLTQIRLTAGATTGEVEQLRNELFRLAKETGTPLEDLQQGFNDLIQSGLNWKESLQVIQATNKATAVTNAQVNILTKGLSVAGAAFQFDLSKPEMAVGLLDKMVVAGRLGNAELESLSSIFARVGVNAQSAGMGFDKTLAFIEGLSMIEREPERLATLADSTLRVFTNARYMKTAQAATGIKFFDAQGSRRDALEVLNDFKKKYDTLKTDAQRNAFVSKAFQGADLDTIKGLRTLLGGDMLTKISGFNQQIGSAAGTLDRDLSTAIDNSVDQVGRLKSALREAADGFAQPINAALSKLIKRTLDSKEAGGMELSGKEVIGLSIGALAGGYLLKRMGSSLLSTAGGVAAGKALEKAAGITPVFVTNWPGTAPAGGDAISGAAGGVAAASLFSKLKTAAALIVSTPLKNLWTLGAAGMAGGAGMVGAAGLAGYGAGTAINKAFIEGTAFQDKLGEAIARALAFAGNREAAEAIAQREQFEGSLKIELNDKRTRVTELRTNSPSMQMDFSHTGMMGAYQ